MMAVHPQSFTPNSSPFGSSQMFNSLGMNDLAADGLFGHCTQAWHVDAHANLISDDSAWVPNPDGEWPASDDSGSLADVKTDVLLAMHTRQQMAITTPPKHNSTQHPTTTTKLQSTIGGGTTTSVSAPPSGVPGAWTPVPGHPSYGMSDFAGDPWSQYFGYCTWYAWYRHQNEPLLRLGNASQWPWTAPSHGLRVGSTPVAGATVVFQPGVEGAGGGGHAAHVEAVLSGGWFIMSEMNFSWNGGGWGRVDWRYAYAGSGVSFIY
jgi:surface antigen